MGIRPQYLLKADNSARPNYLHCNGVVIALIYEPRPQADLIYIEAAVLNFNNAEYVLSDGVLIY